MKDIDVLDYSDWSKILKLESQASNQAFYLIDQRLRRVAEDRDGNHG